jgi:hypothetical protein
VEPFQTDGIFWLASTPDKTAAGTLTFDPVEGGKLKLFGRLTSMQSLFSSGNPELVRIHGGTSRGLVTLENCWSSGSNIGSVGGDQETFYVPFTLTGAVIPSGSPMEFDKMQVGFDRLAPWVQRGGVKHQIDTELPNDLSTATEIRIHYTIPQRESADCCSGQLSLESDWSIKQEEAHASITQAPVLVIEYAESRDIQYILEDVKGLQDLVSLASNIASIPSKITLWRHDLKQQVANRESQTVELYVSNLAEHASPEDRQRKHLPLFSFDRIGGIRTAARWLDLSRRHRIVLGSLLSIRYRQMYEENGYSNVLTAAESFHRMHFPNELVPKADARARRRKIVRIIRSSLGPQLSSWLNEQLLFSNEPRLRQRLVDLAEYAGEGFERTVGSVADWASVTSGIRNRLTHHDENQPLDRQPGDVHFLAESVYILLALCLLRKCQVPDQEIHRIAEHSSIQFVHSRVGEIVPRYMRMLRR